MISVPVPKGVEDENARWFLDLSIKGYTPPDHGSTGGEVLLTNPKDEGAVKVNGFSFFPAEAFYAVNQSDVKWYRFDITSALRDLKAKGDVTVAVQLVDRLHGKVPNGGSIVLDKALIVRQ